jgi:hypothetical protein
MGKPKSARLMPSGKDYWTPIRVQVEVVNERIQPLTFEIL